MRISEEYEVTEVAGEWVVIAKDVVASNQIMILSESAKELWDMLVPGADVEGLVRRLVETYGIDKNLARADVDDFLCQLQGKNLLI